MPRELTQDESDFYEAMKYEDKVLARWVLAKIKDGKDPRDVATLLSYYSDKAQGWCIGRFGKNTQRAPQ